MDIPQDNDIYIVPTFGEAYSGPSGKQPTMDMRDRAIALCRTAEHLAEHGLDLTADDDDRQVAHKLTNAYATNPGDSSENFNEACAGSMTPAVLHEVGHILDEFGQLVVKDAMRIRNLVTNKLILEADGPDPRVRIKALQLLGNMSDVGLFTEKREVIHTNRTAEDLREELRKKIKDMGVVSTEKKEEAVLIEHDD